MTQLSLHDLCRVNTNIENDTFVGIKAVNGNLSVNFPLGYNLSNNDKELRKDILLLMNILSKNTDRKDSEINQSEAFHSVELPIKAYLYVISDYYNRGYYKERDTFYDVSKKGKINWGRTVKTQKSYIQNDEIYYLDFVIRRKSVNENELITLIHEFCVYESFDKIGWLFTSAKPAKPTIKYNKKLFHNVIRKKISETYNDRNRQLFLNMLAIIDYLGDDGPASNYSYGTYRFEYVWETMIDKAFGIQNKSDYFPKTRWKIKDREHENSVLEPDTIMLVNGNTEKVYVIDSKYYKYGWTGFPGHLPESTSINKQITYGEYIAETDRFRNKDGQSPTVYNAFLMPFNASKNKFETDKEIYYVGSAISDWKVSDGLRTYEEVLGILIDVKTLMQNNSHDEDRIIKLANIIEDAINNILD